MPTTEFLERVDSYISGQRSRVYSHAEVCACMIFSAKKLLNERLRQIRQTFPQYLLQFIVEQAYNFADCLRLQAAVITGDGL